MKRRSARWVRVRLWYRRNTGGGTVRLKPGIYTFHSPILLGHGVTIICSASEPTIFEMDGVAE